MKKFAFPLDQVLAWRRTQARIEQTKLEKLQKELRDIAAQAAALVVEEKEAQLAVIRSSSSTGADLAALQSFRMACAQKAKTLEQARAAQEGRIRQQQQVITLKERDVKLLEKLREQKLATWKFENSKEIDSQAEEAFLARWPQRRPG